MAAVNSIRRNTKGMVVYCIHCKSKIKSVIGISPSSGSIEGGAHREQQVRSCRRRWWAEENASHVALLATVLFGFTCWLSFVVCRLQIGVLPPQRSTLYKRCLSFWIHAFLDVVGSVATNLDCDQQIAKARYKTKTSRRPVLLKISFD